MLIQMVCLKLQYATLVGYLVCVMFLPCKQFVYLFYGYFTNSWN